MMIKHLTSKDLIDLQKVGKAFRDVDMTTEQAQVFLENPTNIILVALDDDHEVCGYLLAYRLNRFDNTPDMLHIFHLFILEEHQRKGIASRLMDFILNYAEEEQLHYVYLFTQYDNDGANLLYEKFDGHLHPKDKNVYFWYVSGKPRE